MRQPLNRAVSKLGLASRAEARRLISEGRVTVDGRVVRDAVTPVDIDVVRILVDGNAAVPAQRIVVALHKPRGVVTTRRDPQGRPTVYDLLGDAPGRLLAVGRLDLATSGLLLFTNDSALADQLTSPSVGVAKVYLATVRGRVTEEELSRLRAGLSVDGEMLSPAEVTLRKASNRESLLVITLTEGRNREVRRLCEAIGHEVTRLRRVQIGGLTLGTLPPGEWRLVGEAELAEAFTLDGGGGVRPVAPHPARDTPPASSRRRSPAPSARTQSAGRR